LLEAAAFVAGDVALLQALLFVVTIQLGSGDVAIFHIVVLAHFGRRLSGLVVLLDRFGTLVFFPIPPMGVLSSSIGRVVATRGFYRFAAF
jgi:hypothetical protein